MLKFLVPAVLVFFGILSIAFFDGWPFSSSVVKDSGESTSEEMDLNEDDGADSSPDRRSSSIEFDRPQADSKGLEAQDAVTEPAAAEESAPKDQGLEISVAEETEVLESAEKSGVAALRARLQSLKVDRMSDSYRLALSEAVLADAFPGRQRLALLAPLRDVNRRLVAARARTVVPIEIVEVKPNDNLTRIARRVKKKHGNNVTPAMIMHINRMRRDIVQLGQKLAVPTESISVVARKSDFRLYVLLGESVILDYEIGLGRDDSTPEGKFTVRGKTKNPAWTRPDQTVVAFGDKDHTIGNRWLGLDDAGGRSGYGIHGTVDEDSIGKSHSDGCIRMRKLDVEALFRLVPEGAQVDVRR
ncbi:MAG: L,D-transpeptidase family protein [Planctomycetota bacterium]